RLPGAFRELGLDTHIFGAPRSLLTVSRGRLASHPLTTLLRLPQLIRPALELARIIRRTGATLVHTNSMKAHVIGALAAGLAGVPLVWHVRDILPPGWGTRMLGLVGRRTVHRAIAISDAVHHALVDLCGLDPARVVRVYNGIARPAGARSGALREELGLSPATPIVAAVAQIARWKGQLVLLEAAARLPALHVVLVGEVLFPENETEYSDRLDLRGGRPDLAGRVHRVGRRADVFEILDSVDLLVHPVLEAEPFGRVLVEAMLARRPVVASRTGAVAEIVSDRCGVLVEPGRPDLLAGAIESLLADPDLRRKMGEAGRERAARMFSLDATRLGVEAIYQELVAPGAAGR
ncbi:MAG: glycosyltransferase, partial [Candidatus Riflebacteria bacterium]|nr:glycosyltransferase [Candidatus Riflebacteria bacterium]